MLLEGINEPIELILRRLYSRDLEIYIEINLISNLSSALQFWRQSVCAIRHFLTGDIRQVFMDIRAL